LSSWHCFLTCCVWLWFLLSNNSFCSICSGFSCSCSCSTISLFFSNSFCSSSKFLSACSILNSKYLLQINISIIFVAMSSIVNSGFLEYLMLPIKFVNFVSLVKFCSPISSSLNKSLNIRIVYSLYVVAGLHIYFYIVVERLLLSILPFSASFSFQWGFFRFFHNHLSFKEFSF